MNQHRLKTLFCLTALIGSLVGCGSYDIPREKNSDPPQNTSVSPKSTSSSPESVFASAKAAIDRNDLRTFCECLSLEARDDYVALSVFIAAHMKQGIAILDGQQKAAMVSEQLDALKKKHGLDKAKSLHAAVSLTVNDEVQDEAMREVIVAIKDRNGFIADVDALGRQIDKTEQGKRLLTEDARLDDVKIEGDRATARLLETRDGDVNTESIEFQKIEGRWKIAAMPGISF